VLGPSSKILKPIVSSNLFFDLLLWSVAIDSTFFFAAASIYSVPSVVVAEMSL